MELIKNFRGRLSRANNLDFRLGYCLPASCSEQQAQTYMQNHLINADLVPFGIQCKTNNPREFKIIDIMAM